MTLGKGAWLDKQVGVGLRSVDQAFYQISATAQWIHADTVVFSSVASSTGPYERMSGTVDIIVGMIDDPLLNDILRCRSYVCAVHRRKDWVAQLY